MSIVKEGTFPAFRVLRSRSDRSTTNLLLFFILCLIFYLTTDSQLFKNKTDQFILGGQMLGATRGGTLDECSQSAPSTRGSLGKITAEAAELDSQRQ